MAEKEPDSFYWKFAVVILGVFLIGIMIILPSTIPASKPDTCTKTKCTAMLSNGDCIEETDYNSCQIKDIKTRIIPEFEKYYCDDFMPDMSYAGAVEPIKSIYDINSIPSDECNRTGRGSFCERVERKLSMRPHTIVFDWNADGNAAVSMFNGNLYVISNSKYYKPFEYRPADVCDDSNCSLNLSFEGVPNWTGGFNYTITGDVLQDYDRFCYQRIPILYYK